MADVNRGNRPLSPHLTIYRPQWTSMLSILHRATGVALALGAALAVWWLLAAASGQEYFAFVDGLVTSWIGTLVMVGMLFALSYHLLNGIRHLMWDAGIGLELDRAQMTGMLASGGAGVLTLLVLVLA